MKLKFKAECELGWRHKGPNVGGFQREYEARRKIGLGTNGAEYEGEQDYDVATDGRRYSVVSFTIG